jgi:outer membrane receptor protein involved in Fe transport
MKLLLLNLLLITSVVLKSQDVNGILFDKRTGETLIGASVFVKGTTIGTQTDIDGKYKFKVTQAPPFTLVFSYIGYEPIEVLISSEEQAKKPITMRLSESVNVLKDIEIVDSRITEKQKENPLTIESMGLQQIKQTASSTFYEGLSTMKGVDMTTASLGFVVINTRGFNSTSPVRSLQLLDGCDNQAPGLNFSIGNFAGASEIDIQKVDLIVGASSPLYGPNAFNGVLSMQTKNPFYYQGLTVFVKGAERNLFEGAIRYAKAFKNKKGDDKFAFKIGASYLRAYDWEADNYSRSANINAIQDVGNPGGYDAVNRYGDELQSQQGNSFLSSPKIIRENLGLGQFHRTGYIEKDMVDYNITNVKANAALHYKITDDIEAKVGYNFGYGTTVYQGDNRYSLRGLQFHQVKLEVSKPDKFYVRAYMTAEDAGSTYDAVFTAFKMQEAAKSDTRWTQDYQAYWSNRIVNVGAGPLFQLPGMPASVYQDAQPWFGAAFDSTYGIAQGVMDQYRDSLYQWHNQARAYADTFTNGGAYLPRLIPGTAAFDSIKRVITSTPFSRGGTMFFDQSKLVHAQAEYKWDIKKKGQDKNWFDLITGASFRMYLPYSLGSIFQDTITGVKSVSERVVRRERVDPITNEVQVFEETLFDTTFNYNRITNWEIGGYFSATRKFDFGEGHSIIPTITVRFDRNQNFAWRRNDGVIDPIITPAVSLVYSYKSNHTVRLSYSSAVRNPTLQDQYLYYNVGRAILIGNLNGVDSFISINNLVNYIDKNGNREGIESLRFSTVNGVRPEKVQTLELGYRGLIAKKVYIDAGLYGSLYQNFLGYKLGATFTKAGGFEEGTIRPFQVWRIATNAQDLVATYGFAAGVTYYFVKNFALTGNYSWNELNRLGSTDSIIPAFNTPRHKFNVGISGYDIKIGKQRGFGFNVNYKWIEGFLFEGSPQFTGTIPTYSMLDAQISWEVQKLYTTFKVGGSNLISQRNFQVYGGPGIGRMIYGSILFNIDGDTFNSWNKKKKEKQQEF